MPLLPQGDPRYPSSSDVLFIDEGNPPDISWLNKSFQEFGNYADCYQISAINLINSALEKSLFRDFHIYPAIFLIRQYVELRLKELIQGLNYIENQSFAFPTGHNINELWRYFLTKRQTLNFVEIEETYFAEMKQLINELSTVDPGSFAFRYPVDKEGLKTQKLEYVNLRNLKETFIRMCFTMDGYANLIQVHVEFTREHLNSMYANF